jgi:GxxExxY protein
MNDIDRLASIAVDTGYRLHRDLGPGLLESVYEQVLAAKLRRLGLNVATQIAIDLHYEDVIIKNAFRADIVIEQKLLIEVKSIERLVPLHAKQVITYLRVMSLPLGLLMNFGGETFKEGVRRIVNGHDPLAP